MEERATRRSLPPLSWLVAIAAVALIVGSASGGGVALLLRSSGDDAAASDDRIAAVTRAVRPSVVTIINELAPRSGGSGGVAGGAGFIVDARGFVVTNEHLLRNSARLSVVLNSGETRSATLVSHDAPFTDLAVLRIGAGGLKALPIGRSEALTPGQTVVAIGSPDFDYGNTVTAGVVSGTERRKRLAGVYLDDLIQTDAAINAGNSGGPLVTLAGEAVGIVTFRDIGGEDDLTGISFALSSRSFAPIVRAIIDRGQFARPYFGIDHRDIDPRAAAANGLPVEGGAFVDRVFGGGPAEQAGLRAGDVILRIGRLELGSELPFINALAQLRINERVPVQYWREGRLHETVVAVTAR